MLKNIYSAKNTTSDQLELLRAVRTSLNISEDMHKKIELEVKTELNQIPSPDNGSSTSPMPQRDINILIQTPSPSAKPPAKSQALIKVKIKKYLTLGKEKLRKEDYDGALNLFNKGLELAPDNEEFQFQIKKTKLKLKIRKKRAQGVPEIVEDVPESVSVQSDLSSRVAIPVDTPYTGPMNPGNPSSPTVATITVPQMDNSLPSPSATPVPAAIPVVNVEMPQAAKTAEPDNGSSKSNKKESGGCMSCEGKGSCYWCNGSGKCDRCNGTGEYNEGSCTMCSGSGKCNSCGGDGTCMWCKGSGNNLPRRNDVYTA